MYQKGLSSALNEEFIKSKCFYDKEMVEFDKKTTYLYISYGSTKCIVEETLKSIINSIKERYEDQPEYAAYVIKYIKNLGIGDAYNVEDAECTVVRVK